LSSIINNNIINYIGVDVLKLIFALIPWNTFIACRRVCKEWYHLLKSSASWPRSKIDHAHKIVEDCTPWNLMAVVSTWLKINYGEHLYLLRTCPYSYPRYEDWVLL